MFKNRFVLFLSALSMLLVTVVVSQPFSKSSKTVVPSQSSRPVVLPVTGLETGRPAIMDSATRSYTAWAEALQNAKLNGLDSGTRSYIAWAQAVGEAGACVTTSQENISTEIPEDLDSATRSYIAWGMALQAKNKMGTLCR